MAERTVELAALFPLSIVCSPPIVEINQPIPPYHYTILHTTVGDNEFEDDEPDPYGEDFEDNDNGSPDPRDKHKGNGVSGGGSTKNNVQGKYTV